jgi:hypothetical protein
MVKHPLKPDPVGKDQVAIILKKIPDIDDDRLFVSFDDFS